MAAWRATWPPLRTTAVEALKWVSYLLSLSIRNPVADTKLDGTPGEGTDQEIRQLWTQADDVMLRHMLLLSRLI
jgi:hypothetical protein